MLVSHDIVGSQMSMEAYASILRDALPMLLQARMRTSKNAILSVSIFFFRMVVTFARFVALTLALPR